MREILLAMLLLPLCGALVQAFFGLRLGRRASGGLACLTVAGAFVLAVAAMWALDGKTESVDLGTWFGWEGFQAKASLLYDPLAGLMALSVTFVAGLIHIYSTGFMREDQAFGRYFCYLNLFVFFMLVITLADDLVFLFVGWEGVGFCSYALIGFWHQKTVNVNAGNKAFILTRIGDLGLVAALAILIAMTGQASVSGVAALAPSLDVGMATLLGFLLLLAATGKSAQLPLTVWLPDAMAGPTPVSALIHAATMVTAGVYLLMRVFPLLEMAPLVLPAVALVGAVTALYGSLAALGQRDLKRILAYSTVSQVGYMFLGVGCGDVTGSMFHLVAHAGFKALLFMCAGILIQAVHEEHDIFRMGARLKKELPGVFFLFLAGSAALSALPLTSGFFTKGRVLVEAFSRPGPVFALAAVLGGLAAFVTALYVFRMVFVIFWNTPADPAPLHRDPAIARMARPLWPLGAWALFLGFLNLPPYMNFGLPALFDTLLAGVPGGHVAAHSTQASLALELWVEGGDAVVALFGMWLAWQFFGPGRAVAVSPGILTAGFGLDALYLGLVAAPYRWLAGLLWRGVDDGLLDRGVASGAGGLMTLSLNLRRLSTGRISTTLAMLLAAMAFALVYVAAHLA